MAAEMEMLDDRVRECECLVVVGGATAWGILCNVVVDDECVRDVVRECALDVLRVSLGNTSLSGGCCCCGACF